MEQQGTSNQKKEDEIESLMRSLKIDNNQDDFNFYTYEDLLNNNKRNLELKCFLDENIEKLKSFLNERQNLVKELLEFRTKEVSSYIFFFDYRLGIINKLIDYETRDKNIKDEFIFFYSKLVNFIQKEFIDKKIFIESYNSEVYGRFIVVPDLFLDCGKQIQNSIDIIRRSVVDLDRLENRQCCQIKKE